MASGPYPDPRRGSWSVQFFDGTRWRRVVVARRRPGWKPGMPMPAKPPPEAMAALGVYIKREQEARRRGGARPADPDRTVADFLGDHRASYALGHPASSVAELDKAIGLFLPWCTDRKLARLDQVDATACQRWLDDRARASNRRTGRPISYARLRQERSLLATAWAKAARRLEVPANPWTAVEIGARPTRTPKGSWSPSEYDRLLAAARPWLRDVLVVGCHTGLRISALLAMQWDWVHWARTAADGLGRVVVPAEWDKAGRGYHVPIHSTVHDLLSDRLLHRDTDRVLVGASGRPCAAGTVGRAIVRACRRAGLPKPISPCHHMRRTFGRWAVLGHLTGKPIPLYVVSKWFGHSSVKMSESYLDLNVQESSGWMESHTPGESPGV